MKSVLKGIVFAFLSSENNLPYLPFQIEVPIEYYAQSRL